MTIAPADEAYRLEVLKSYKILDTDPDPNFDRIAKLLVTYLDAPIAYISFVDSNRQWFKAGVGVPVIETDRAEAICSHTIEGTAPVIVPDLLEDPRFCDNPFVVNPPHIRFYAGHPIIVPEGVAIGSVCIIGTEPRTDFSEKDQALLADCAAIIVEHLVCWKMAQDKIVSLDDALSGARSVADAARRAKAEFLNVVGHELKTPLTPILGYSEMLSSQNIAAERVPEIARLIERAGTRLLRVIDTVMTYTQMDRGRLTLNETEISANCLLRDIVETFGPESEERGVRLALREDATGDLRLKVDPLQLELLLMQILENAVIYAGGGADITIETAWSDSGALCVVVEDTGPGIPEDVQRSMDARAATTRLHGYGMEHGVGIGLPLAARLAELHGGALTVGRSERGGARVAITLPRWRVIDRHRRSRA